MTKQRMGVWVAGAAVAAAMLAGCSSTSTTSTGSSGATVAPGSSVAGTSPTTEGTTPKGTTPKGTTKPSGTTPKGDSGDTSAFCASVKSADDRSQASSGAPQSKPTKQEIYRFIDDLKAARDAGPAEIQEPLTTIIDAYTGFAEIVDDPNPDEKAMELFLSEKSLTAEEKLKDFVKRECGFTINSGSSSGSTTNDTGPPSTLSLDDRPTSVSNVKAAIKTKAGNLSWAPAINGGSWGYSGDGTTYNWTVQADSTERALSADSALDACTMIADHLAPLQPSFSLQIQSSDGTTLAEKTAGGTACKKV
jgi:hypothetical protein